MIEKVTELLLVFIYQKRREHEHHHKPTDNRLCGHFKHNSGVSFSPLHPGTLRRCCGNAISKHFVNFNFTLTKKPFWQNHVLEEKCQVFKSLSDFLFYLLQTSQFPSFTSRNSQRLKKRTPV